MNPAIPARSVQLEEKPRRRAAKWLAFILIATILFYGAAGYFASSQVIGEHRAWREFIAAPADFGLQAEVVSFSSTDGVPLKGAWLRAEGSARADVVLAHGRDANRSHMLSRANFLVHNGYNALAIDLRDHGESGGHFISPGYLEAHDIIGAVQYLRQRGEQVPVAAMGHSYGAVAALMATADSPEIAAGISDGAFTSADEVLINTIRHFEHSPDTPLWAKGLFLLSHFPGIYSATEVALYLRTGYRPRAEDTTVMPWVERLHKPVLFISGGQDFISPTEDARRMFAACPSAQKTLLVIPQAGHNTTYKVGGKQYENAVLAFLDTALAAR